MQQKSLKRLFLILLSGIIYIIALQIMYVNSISIDWWYYGFENNFSYTRCFIAYALCGLTLILVYGCLGESSFSKTVVSFILLGNAIPCFILYICMPSDFILMLVCFFVFLAAFEWILPSIKFTWLNRASSINVSKLIDVIFLIIIGVTLFIWIVYAKFHIQIDIFDVYDTRLAARTYSMPTIVTYLFSMSRNLNPLIAIIYLHDKKHCRFFLSLITHALIFSISANKATLFLMFFGIGLYIIAIYGKSILRYFVYALAIGGILGILESLVIGSKVIINVFFRRILILPALLNYQYYEYFSNNGFNYYAQSIGELFGIKSKYNSSLPTIIGSAYYTDATNANNGLFSDAYANLGAIGIIIIPLLLILILKVADAGSKNIPKAVWTVSALQFYFSLVSSSLFTVLLTHGALAVILIFYLMNNQKEVSTG